MNTSCCPLPTLDPIEQRRFFLAKIRSTFTTLVYAVQAIGCLGIMSGSISSNFTDSWYDGLAATVMLILLVPHILAIYHSECSDCTLIRMTQVYQSCFTILAIGRIILALHQSLICPALTGSTILNAKSLETLDQNCTILASEMNEYHADARGSVLAYSVTVLFPIMLMLNNITVKTVILPIVTVLSGAK
jgi:hypothetical protein